MPKPVPIPIVVVAEPAHAVLSPSASSRWIPCPGSVSAQQAVGPDTSNEYSILGTAAHALLEISLRLGSHPLDFVGATLIPAHPEVTEEMAEAVNVACEYIEDYLDAHGHDKVELHIERRVAIGPMIDVAPEFCNGTSDVQLVHKDKSRLVTIDYKHGSGLKVGAQDNPQLMLYSAGGRLAEGGDKFKQYCNVIIQPRAGKRISVDEWTYNDSKLTRWLRETVAPSARAALLPNAPRNAGTHCRWCRAAPVCRTYRQKAIAIATTEFSPLDEEGEPVNDPRDIPLSEYPRILHEAEVLQNWINQVKGHALHVLESGGKIEGWRLGWSKRRREWDNTEAAIEWVESQGVELDDYMPRELLSPAGMTKLLKHLKKYPRKARGSKEEPANPLDAFIRYSIPKPALKPADSDEFDELDDE